MMKPALGFSSVASGMNSRKPQSLARLQKPCTDSLTTDSAALTSGAEAAPVDLSDLDGDEAAASAGGMDAAAAKPEAELLSWAAALLAGISRLNRFDLTLDFADKATLTTLAGLLPAMEAAGVGDAQMGALRRAYGGSAK